MCVNLQNGHSSWELEVFSLKEIQNSFIFQLYLKAAARQLFLKQVTFKSPI